MLTAKVGEKSPGRLLQTASSESGVTYSFWSVQFSPCIKRQTSKTIRKGKCRVNQMSDLSFHSHGSFYVKASQKLLCILSMYLCAGIFSNSALAQNYIANGVGAYTEFSEQSLLIRLELEAPAANAVEVMAADTNKKLSFRLMQNRSPRAWSKIWIQNLSINNTADTLGTQTDDLIAMTQAVKGTLRTGDLVEFERVAPDLTIMSVNGIEIADFETPGFFEFLLTAFIGPVPPSSELKNQLLAEGQRFGQEAILFDSLGFTQERVAQIASWNVPEVPDVADTTESEEAAEADVDEAVELAGEETEDATTATSEEETDVAADPATAALEDEAGEETQEVSVDETAPIASGDESEPVNEDEDEAPVMITAESLLAAQNYQRSVLQAVYRELEYPSSALRRNREGSLRLAIAINANGLVSSAEVIDSAEFDVFDEAAINAIEAASPFDPLPEGTLEIPMLLEIPIAFRLE
jgi:protein TonB